jgi:hypothetical protein
LNCDAVITDQPLIDILADQLQTMETAGNSRGVLQFVYRSWIGVMAGQLQIVTVVLRSQVTPDQHSG